MTDYCYRMPAQYWGYSKEGKRVLRIMNNKGGYYYITRDDEHIIDGDDDSPFDQDGKNVTICLTAQEAFDLEVESIVYDTTELGEELDFE